MAWIEWHGNVLPTSDKNALIRCALEPPGSLARPQSWSFSLDHFVKNPEEIEVRGGLELALFIEIPTLGFQVTDWRHIGRQEFVTTADWHARSQHCGPYGHISETWLSVGVMEHDHGTGRMLHRDWLADYYCVTFSPPTGYLFPCEIEAWLMPEEAFHTGAPLVGQEIRRIPAGPPNLRILCLANFKSGRITCNGSHPDPTAVASRRLMQAIALEDCVEMTPSWWAETERTLRKVEGPPPASHRRRCDVSFKTASPVC